MNRLSSYVAPIALSLSIIAIMGCSQSLMASDSKYVTPEELASNPDKFDGKHVTLKGYVVVAPEKRDIFQSKSAYEDPNGVCLGLDGPNSLFRKFTKREISGISGTFRKQLCRENEVCLYWCGKSGIELDEGTVLQ
jgi:hypothetical protein